MGCDIHMCCERKSNSGKWVSADRFGCSENGTYYQIPLYDGRNYELFGILAGVRSYENEMISEPKGLPDNICKATEKETEIWELDGHSYSWLTAQELFEYREKHKTTTYSGYLSQDQIEALDRGIYPSQWYARNSNPGYELRTWTENRSQLDPLLDRIKERMMEEFGIWDLYDEDKEQAMLKHNAKNFRIVFWFDN